MERAAELDAPAPAGDGGGAPEAFDVLIVGAGLSGIAAAWYLQDRLPGKSFAILEGRDAIGGTWDLFRYPGMRSDSDMHTLGYSFHPWRGALSIARGPAIAAYLRDSAAAFGIDRRIRFGHRAVRAAWSSAAARWTVEAELGPERRPARFACRFLFMCSGYYDYARGYLPDWPGMARFGGRIVHPQSWPDDLDWRGRRVVVIGSGATAVTLVPELARQAAHVTMLQRSPGYVVSRPARDGVAAWLNRRLPGGIAHRLVRWKNVGLGIWFYRLCRRRPERVRAAIMALARKRLGGTCDVERHFAPRYAPWDQRLCLAPDGDLFEAIRCGRASVVTDDIERFAEAGPLLRSGERLDADIVVAATGLNLQLMGGMQVAVDGRIVDPGGTLLYKGAMLSGVPNLALALGYANASWTLRCELSCAYVCRLLAHMDAHGHGSATPRRPAGTEAGAPAFDLASGYVRRAARILPRQGAARPWRTLQNYVLDAAAMRLGRVDDGAIAFAPIPVADRSAASARP